MQLSLFKEKEVDLYYHITKIDPVDIWDPIEKRYPIKEKGILKGEYTLYKTGFTDDIYVDDGNIFCGIKTIRGKILGQHMHHDGYMRVTLTMNDENGRRVDRLKYSWHRLIALAFIKNDDPKRKTSVHHKNKKKDHNRLSNLEWVSLKENNLEKNVVKGRRISIRNKLREKHEKEMRKKDNE